jgi:hypothetical protein
MMRPTQPQQQIQQPVVTQGLEGLSEAERQKIMSVMAAADSDMSMQQRAPTVRVFYFIYLLLYSNLNAPHFPHNHKQLPNRHKQNQRLHRKSRLVSVDLALVK